jgi:hypothetical protein
MYMCNNSNGVWNWLEIYNNICNEIYYVKIINNNNAENNVMK